MEMHLKKVTTRYVCDRCGGDAAYTACHGDPPHAEAYFAVGLYGGGGTERASFKDLCRNCHDALDDWMRQKQPNPLQDAIDKARGGPAPTTKRGYA